MSRITRRLSLQPNSHREQQQQREADPVRKAYKVLLLGSGGVGKTQLLNRLLSHPFNPRYHRTIEELHLLETPNLRLEIMDTAGSYEFPAMRNLNIKNSDGFLVVFDVTEEGTLEEATSLLQLIHSHKPNSRITLAANKTDLSTPTSNLLDSDKYSQLISDYNVIQTSALSGDGCEKLWKQVVGELATVEKLRRVSVGEVMEGKEKEQCQLV